jgi:hypothetical protein
MNDKLPARRTLLPALPPGVGSALVAGLMSLAAIALIALGVALIYVPAGVITAGLGLVALEFRFFGDSNNSTG